MSAPNHTAEALAPCPFCGAGAVIDGPRALVEHRDGCYLRRFVGSSQIWLSLDAANWNRRTPAPDASAIKPFDPVWLSMLYAAADESGPTHRGAIMRAYDYLAALGRKEG